MERLTVARTPHCCKIGCDRAAEFQIEDMADARPGGESLTEACVQHVGELLGHQTDLPEDAEDTWTVRALPPKERRWTIYVCPTCGEWDRRPAHTERDGSPGHMNESCGYGRHERAVAVDVVPAPSPEAGE